MKKEKQTEKEIAKYDNLQKIVEQLEKCNYGTECGYLKNNVAFISLQRMAQSKPAITEEDIKLKLMDLCIDYTYKADTPNQKQELLRQYTLFFVKLSDTNTDSGQLTTD